MDLIEWRQGANKWTKKATKNEKNYYFGPKPLTSALARIHYGGILFEKENEKKKQKPTAFVFPNICCLVQCVACCMLLSPPNVAWACKM